ncbi:MAG: hypothetical protein QOE84_645 [Actinomycetota bacterium]|jgi:uncharacterized alpha-E superfamily protein|nr:hypothetical protein [Actinomycetota bacterium]
MLSRVAEGLYWIGRYIERAEDTARLLEVHINAMLEDPWVDESAACKDVLRVMGLAEASVDPTAAGTSRKLAFARDETSSICGALIAARENARGVREALSSELWECLNATFHTLDAQEASSERYGPFGFLRYVRERAATFTGLVDTSMPRDDGWRFLVLGRSLERVDMTTRLLWVRGGRGSGPSWTELLKCCSAYEAYLRTYRSAVDPDRVVEFLVLDRLFPRSIFAALTQAESCLAGLDPTAGRTGVGDEARRLLGRARTDLEFRRAADLYDDLPVLLDGLQRTCAESGDAVADRYFHYSASTSWAREAG